jgi:hypothetical protein
LKKLLIIQQDDAYFLFETIQVIEKNLSAFKDFELTVLVNKNSYHVVFDHSHPIFKEITTNEKVVFDKNFDLSANLSLNEASWALHGIVKSKKKIGPYALNGQTFVEDLWSSYLMTLKAKAPFLTFHLQDVYKNILGVRGSSSKSHKPSMPKQIVIGTTASHLFTANEQESLIYELAMNYPNLALKDLSEIDFISDLSQSLYIGPSTLEALKFCAAGGKGIFLTSAFQGFNLIPYDNGNVILSSQGGTIQTNKLLKVITDYIEGRSVTSSDYSLYTIEHNSLFGPILNCHNSSDEGYPFYQSHTVLWNFLLNLYELNLPISKCSANQLKVIQTQNEVLKKYLRLHDYAMVSIDTVYHESRSKSCDVAKVEGHLKNLVEIDSISDQIASSHPILRPVIDFYRIRRGQNSGQTLNEQAQHSFLAYSEEHQALQALQELFSVTLKENEVNI